MSGEIHMGRLGIGAGWSFLGIMLSSIYAEQGFDVLLSIGLGILTVPFLLLTVYLIGAVGYRLMKEFGVFERIQ